jgi:LmbE family N-acetylglucosaminyl deacetylase
MKLKNSNSDLFIPSGEGADSVLPKTSHLAIGAHQDDIEIFALHGILECFQKQNRQFGAVIATNGAGSPRSGPYASYSDQQMMAIRVREQQKAALVGDYGFVAQLGYSSSSIKTPEERDSVDELASIIGSCSPEVLYLHNPFDKHDTHLGVLAKCLSAVRLLPAEKRPKTVLGCEVWRDLDWLPDELKVPLCVDGHPNLSAALLGVFDSQISGGKRYDLAADGRRLANATFFQSHSVDAGNRIIFALDMTLFFNDESVSMAGFMNDIIDRFTSSTAGRMLEFLPAE